MNIYSKFEIDPDYPQVIRAVNISTKDGLGVIRLRNKNKAQSLCNYLNALIKEQVKPPKNWRTNNGI